MTNIDWQVYGLIGAAQASNDLNDFLTNNGFLEQKSFNTMVRSILVTKGDTLEDIYGSDLSLWKRGINTLTEFLSNPAAVNSEAFYYFMSLLKLAKVLQNNNHSMTIIGGELEVIQYDIHQKTIDFDEVLERLNSCYKANISKLDFRIKVKIRKDMSFDEKKEAKMRTLLFTGLRSAMLWRQGGGTLPKMLFNRKKILTHLKQILP